MKLVAILILPMMLLVFLGVGRVLEVQDNASSAQREAELAQAVTGPGSLLQGLIDERNATAVHILGAEANFDTIEEDAHLPRRDTTDQHLDEFLDQVEDGGEIQELYQPAIDALPGIAGVRDDIDAIADEDRSMQNVTGLREYVEAMSEVIDPLLDANADIRTTVSNQELQRGVILVDRASRQFNSSVLLVFHLAQVALEAAPQVEEDGSINHHFRDIMALHEELRLGNEELRRYGVEDYQPLADNLFEGGYIEELRANVEQTLQTGAPDLSSVFGTISGGSGEETLYSYSTLRDDAAVVINDAAEKIDNDAARARQIFMIAAVLVLLLVGAITTMVAVSITRPLRRLTRQAIQMCEERLPRAVQGILETPPGEDVVMPSLPPVEVHSRDEVADVATALTSVQESALGLAVEQAALRRNIADSYVNLGRRNQSLVGRQLDFITELEKNEADPEALANLFKLDHLATRMRRNAESLLVLAGIEPPRKWSAPVRLTDVVRAALGEVEDYQRVAVRGVEPATIVGSAAADLAHLLAELIENSLTFSPPDQAVEIRGRFTLALPSPSLTQVGGDGEGAYTLSIVDSGLGMTGDDIERANRRLAGAESFTIAPSKYLGHYVAGMIAVRHGIQVELQSSPQRGVTATLILPAKLLSSQDAAGSPLANSGALSGGATDPTPSGASQAIGAPVGPLGQLGGPSTSGTNSPSPFAPISPDGQPLDVSGPAVPSPAYMPSNPPPMPGGPMARPAGTQPAPGQPVPTAAYDLTRPPATDPALPASGQPASYRIGETEFTIDLGTSAAALPTGNDDRNQLIQRIQGAQMPQTQMASLSRGPGGNGGNAGNTPAAPPTVPTPTTKAVPRSPNAPNPPATAPEPVQNEARAGQVRNFLASFSTGLEQGRDAAARELGDSEEPSEET